MESQTARAERLQKAQEESLKQRLGPNHLIPVISGGDGGSIATDNEEPAERNPVEGACYDALIYIREGMSRQDTLTAVLTRNSISKSEAEKIIDQVINNHQTITKEADNGHIDRQIEAIKELQRND
jgi:hypothetical protein